jgi:hypothetical protein
VLGDNGEIVDRSKAPSEGARGGSAPGRVLAKAFEVDGQVMTSEQACKYLNITKVSKSADGTQVYYAKALAPHIASGRVRRVVDAG